jgi:hypothetical protein
MASLTPSPLIVFLLLTAEGLPFFALGLPAGALAELLRGQPARGRKL